jgi:aspartate/methionine/tyrosine aminotransferase
MREAIPAFQKRNADLGFLHPSRIELRILRNLSELKWSRNEALGPGHIFWVERMAVLKDMRETIRKMLTDLELPYVLPEKGPPYVLAKIPDGISFDDLREILAKQSPSVFVGFGSCHGADGFIRFCLIRPSCDAVRACESFAKAGAQIREKLALAK